jgi:hypothetical protein
MKRPYIALVFAGMMAAAVPARADEKNGLPKADVKGTLVLEGTTYKMANGLAYETTRFDRKQTVVYLSEKALDTAKLKASFKKNGTDADFFASGPHIRLIFDDKGELFQISIHARGANIILQGDPNIKAEAAIKDGVAKGTAKSVKPDKDYEFTATFEIKLMKP